MTKDEVLKQDLNELIYELKKVKGIGTIDNNKFLAEIFERQRKIYEQFNVSLPDI